MLKGIKESGNKKLTAGPGVLGARVPIIAVETESKKVPIGIKSDAWRSSDRGRGDE